MHGTPMMAATAAVLNSSIWQNSIVSILIQNTCMHDHYLNTKFEGTLHVMYICIINTDLPYSYNHTMLHYQISLVLYTSHPVAALSTVLTYTVTPYHPRETALDHTGM